MDFDLDVTFKEAYKHAMQVKKRKHVGKKKNHSFP
jgi:hypothetical protein